MCPGLVHSYVKQRWRRAALCDGCIMYGVLARSDCCRASCELADIHYAHSSRPGVPRPSPPAGRTDPAHLALLCRLALPYRLALPSHLALPSRLALPSGLLCCCRRIIFDTGACSYRGLPEANIFTSELVKHATQPISARDGCEAKHMLGVGSVVWDDGPQYQTADTGDEVDYVAAAKD